MAMWFFIALLAFIVLAVVLKSSVRASKIDWPVYARAVLSPVEQTMYNRLVRAYPEHVVLAQVSMSRFIGVKKGASGRGVFNRFNRMTVDYILCTRDFRTVAVLELDDRSHDRPDRVVADRKKTEILNAAGIPLFRFNVNPMPNEVDLHNLIQP